ncbi:protein LURP-one-related 15-like [Cryptomeria japonica]|uniref:protein LURP-one-related 15-like n=1 Tax=Cryptomeria japonica TaxID=3369 RepID=UPI0027DA2BF8|nr:protein LURP-one-related 15-like [Cryptomeria japonica]
MEDAEDTVAVVAGRYFCAPYPIELTLEKIGKDFIIADSNGNIVLTMVALHDRCLLEDAKGNVLLTMIKKLKMALDVFLLSNLDEKHCDFRVRGSYLQRDCTIYRGDRVVAEMKRKYTRTNVLLEKDTFVVVVEPGIDCAFIVSLVVILDQITRDYQN